MKNATITVWLDQETEDKVAVGLTIHALYYPRYLLFSIAACVERSRQKRVKLRARQLSLSIIETTNRGWKQSCLTDLHTSLCIGSTPGIQHRMDALLLKWKVNCQR